MKRQKISYACFFFALSGLFSIGSLRAQETELHILAIKLGYINSVTNYDSLYLNYFDQASPQHHLTDNFHLGNSPRLIGGELIMAAVTTKKGFYFDGVNLGFYAYKKTNIFQFGTGAGYSLNLGEKFSIVPAIGIGYGLHNTHLGTYYPLKTDLIVNGKKIRGDFDIDISHNTLYALPKLSFFYRFSESLGIRLMGGYRLDMLSKEKINISEHCQSCDAVRTARTSIHSGIMSNGQYVNGKLMRFNGLNFGIEFVYTLSDL